MKRLLIFIFSCAVISSCARVCLLKEDGWNPTVRDALNEMMVSLGRSSEGYDPSCKPYAVFDYDNTTVINDIAQTLLVYQIENRAFAIPDTAFFDVLTETLPDLEADYGKGYTVRDLAGELARDYHVLSSFEDLSKMRETPEYLDFRAKLWYFSAMTEVFSPESAFGCIWIATLLDRMLPEEIISLVRASVDHWLLYDSMYREVWTSPDGRITVRPPKGLALTKEMKELYKALKTNGFDVYICSASPEIVVEAMACDPCYGLGLDPENVFGIRLSEHPDGTMHAIGDAAYIQPYRTGKVGCIENMIAPKHGGRGPALVAGDSNGDYAMLTSFPDLRVGLIINCLNRGNIATLRDNALTGSVSETGTASPIYIVQGRDPATKTFVPVPDSNPVQTVTPPSEASNGIY